MEFDSPDVAKEFPGLYKEDIDEGGGGSSGGKGKKSKSSGSMNDPNDYDDDSDKSSKKKKDKKESKKDKGYAALAGESSPDEADRAGSKSPGRVKKLKAFKLTSSSKKNKDKDKEKDAAKAESSAASGGETSKKEKKNSSSSEKESKRERKLSSEASKPQKSEKSLFDLVRKHSVPTPASTSISLAPPATQAERPSSTGRTRHSVPFSPTALAANKEEKHEKHGHGKKEIIDGVKVRLKLKKGSKNSLEEPPNEHPHVSSSSAAPTVTQGQAAASGHQVPEDPEILAKEIKKYEILLEQSHSQIQSSKKVNKKHEEQLWELQRTLTQLKRKLRSVNALSCGASISSNPATAIFNPPPPTGTATVTRIEIAQQPQRAAIATDTILQPQKALAAQTSPLEPVVVVGVVAPPELIPESVEEISHSHDKQQPQAVRSPTLDTVQVQAEVHSERAAVADDREYENVTIGPERERTAAVLEKKGSGESSSSSLVFENVPDSNGKSKTSSTLTSTNASVTSQSQNQNQIQIRQKQQQHVVGGVSLDLDQVDSDFVNLRLSNHTDARAKRNSLPSSQRLESSSSGSSPFNPFMVPLFRTDEFIAWENDALISFNQALQDQIIEEEEEIGELVKEIGDMIDDNHGLLLGVTVQDLEELDNDELVSMLENVKHENDVLHDQVNNLKAMVAKAKLEEFQLELRLKYLQDQSEEEIDTTVTTVQPPPAATVAS